MAVRYRTHNAAHRKAVEIVIHEDHDTQGYGSQLCTDPCLNALRSPATESRGSAGPVHQRHQDSQQHQEHQDSRIPGIRDLRDHSRGILCFICRSSEEQCVNGKFQIKIGIEQGSRYNAHKQ